MTISTESCPTQVFATKEMALQHGKGGIWYEYEDVPNPQFPENVSSVWIVMPVYASQTQELYGKGIACKWTINHKNHCNAQWQLSGTYDKPTLSPSLHWVGMWHGWLRDGYLTSC